MDKFRIKIDEKSLFYGIYNNFLKGEVMTSATPINQSKNPLKWHQDIMKLINFDLGYKGNIPDMLLKQCLRKTTSKAESKLIGLYIFDNVYLDGKKLNCNYSYALYIKQEIDEYIRKRDGSYGHNTHLGRMKLHYPKQLIYTYDGFNINNAEILNSILKQNGGFAFIVRGFEIDIKNHSINFITSCIGLEGILLSNVFKIQKGVGKKLLLDSINFEAQDIDTDTLIISPTIKSSVQGDNVFDDLKKVQKENGDIGEKYVFENLDDIVKTYAKDAYHTSKDFPTSPYDIEYTDVDGNKQYIEVKSTSGSKGIFNMSCGELKFMQQYKDCYKLILVTEVKNPIPKIKILNCDQILKLKKTYPSTRFYA